MKFFFLFFVILFLVNCSKAKTVLVCGDHICINKKEAEHYFQENLSIEVRLINKKKDINEIDLVELNLNENQKGEKKISIFSKKNTKKDLKILSSEEIIDIKKKIKNKSKEKKIAQKFIKKKQKIINEDYQIKQNKKKIVKENIKQRNKDVVDVCIILENCTIDEISKYLLKQGKKREFPDITTRQ